MENLYTPNCIRTFTGQYVNVFNPDINTINIEDIAHALSNQCRFGGHLPKFYSVAQHSLMCCQNVDDEYKLQALLHDASEAYLLDIPSPIKQGLSNYKDIENNLMICIAEKFGFKYPLDAVVKKIDQDMLQFEWDHLMLEKPLVYFDYDNLKMIFPNINNIDWFVYNKSKKIKNEFLRTFEELTNFYK